VALLLSLVVAYALARSISRPIARLAAGAEAMAHGDYGQRLPVEGRDELAALTQRFNEMAAEVGRAHRMERDFVANVSHDLKTPLTSIQGFSQAMLDGAIVDEAGYRQAGEIINSEAQRMSRLVSELLGLSHLQSGLDALETRPVELGALLSQLMMAMQPQATNAGVELKLALRERHPIWVLASEDRLKQAFCNLIDNALKFTSPGGRVTLEAREAGSIAEVLVRDTGQGIPAEDLPRIMERFYQVDKSRSSFEGRSAGLGLAIARDIVRAHNGEISIHSEMGAGTTVRVELPAQPAPEFSRQRGGVLKRLAAPVGRSVKSPGNGVESVTGRRTIDDGR